MTNEQNNDTYGPIPAKYLAFYIVLYRKQRGWTQETLAELTKLSVRTIQRVENGKSSSPDVRRALASVFELEDIDIFNRPFQHPDEAALREEYERLQKETITLSVKKVICGRQLREMAEDAQAHQFEAREGLSKEAEYCFAELQDYLQDCDGIYQEMTAIQKLEVNEELQSMLERFNSAGVSLGIAVGNLKMGDEKDPFFMRSNCYIAAPNDTFPEKIMLNKSVRMSM
ncbi:transcriptional regulator%2C y4mF family [Legionella pneumophila]|uniref:helix-turn-helix domain-containing protein n=1 Tax=Legionella pneumophila TaxID=446 RepID=UPI0007708EB1|nr:helix-turn-helix transcriptional regulator [Legionella pneumophila]CZP46120.1 transcriptional regulator%2C y4mF family [Legionella pneumophila]